MDLPLISIIVPVYNTEKYLSQCINHIIEQTYKNIEIILINDGSTDKSGEICDKFVETDCRCRVVHKANEGVACARNIAIEISNGQYISFVDSDDFISKDYIESLYQGILKYGTQISICDYIESNMEELNFNVFENKRKESVLVKIDDEYDFNADYAHKTVWAAMYSRELIKSGQFDTKLFVAEDSLFYAQLLQKVDAISYIKSVKYIYMIYENSASHGKYDEKKFTEIVAINKIKMLYENSSNFTRNSIDAWYCTMCVKGIRMSIQSKWEDSEKLKYLIQEARKSVMNVLKSNLLLKTKILCLGFSYAPNLSFGIYTFIKSILAQ